jgi:hypothetical protein
MIRALIAAIVFLVAWLTVPGAGSFAQVRVRTKIVRYIPPRPLFAGLHVAMPEDSAFLVLRKIAARRDTLIVDSVTLLESDSVRIFGQAAFIQLQIVHHRVRTIVINWHPLGGDGYTNLRDQLTSYLEGYFGRGVVLTNESLTYHRWETEDGTSEVSHSDKYFRIFVRLGKPRE